MESQSITSDLEELCEQLRSLDCQYCEINTGQAHHVQFIEFIPFDWLTFFMLSKAFVFSKKDLLWVYHHCEGITS